MARPWEQNEEALEVKKRYERLAKRLRVDIEGAESIRDYALAGTLKGALQYVLRQLEKF